jgi:hypothetical protein
MEACGDREAGLGGAQELMRWTRALGVLVGVWYRSESCGKTDRSRGRHRNPKGREMPAQRRGDGRWMVQWEGERSEEYAVCSSSAGWRDDDALLAALRGSSFIEWAGFEHCLAAARYVSQPRSPTLLADLHRAETHRGLQMPAAARSRQVSCGRHQNHEKHLALAIPRSVCRNKGPQACTNP